VYGTFHKVQYTEEALHACVQLTDRYISDRCFPDKAIDAMDEAGAYKRQTTQDADSTPIISESDIALVVSRMSGVPVQRVAQAETQQLRQMGTTLKQRVIGQDKAIDTIVKAIQRSRMGLRDPKKPIGTFFLLGPTGVGKTHLAQCLAEEMFGNRDAIIRFDMSEYIEKHTVSLLVGAPPGYIAHEDGGKLTEAVRRKPYSIVLFDEIEKAHPDIFNVLLQVMDEGRLTDRQGHIVDFKNTIIIMTSNVGTRQLNEFGSGIGFDADILDDKQTERTLTKALNRTFPPEFVNRLDNVVIFNPLSDESLAQILTLELYPLKMRLEVMGYELEVTDQTRDKLLQQSKERKYGARPLKRAIQTLVEDPITDLLLNEKIENKLIKI
jgi:ATP-dependent Clp protease ATP-binding subunit ClpC